MSSHNPYQPPQTVGPANDRILVRNFNDAGGPLAMTLVIGPLLIGATIWMMASGRMKNATLEGNITILTLMALAELGGLIYAIRVPTLWVELGPTIRYGSLASTHEVEWRDVRRIWFDRADEYARIGPIRVTLSKNHALVVEINDYKELRVLVPAHKLELLRSILSRHPRFLTMAQLHTEILDADKQSSADLNGEADDEDGADDRTEDRSK
jgi:hypothetical protein